LDDLTSLRLLLGSEPGNPQDVACPRRCATTWAGPLSTRRPTTRSSP
jgi:hypothetical protein